MTTLKYVTLQEVKWQLEIVESDTRHDGLLNMYIEAASASVKNHLKSLSVYLPAYGDDDEPELDSNYEPELQSFDSTVVTEQVRPEVKHAVLMLVASWFLNREGMGEGGLPPAVQAVLYPLRDPQLK